MTGADWIGYEQALATVLAAVESVGAERVPTSEALGRALAQPLIARVDNPPWDNSAMDGFAVHAADVKGASAGEPVSLPISDEIPAGRFPKGPLEPGTAARIMTGAPVPRGASGVIRVEHTDRGTSQKVSIFDDADAERHIRVRAEDISTGQTLLDAGAEITPAAIALLAMNGVTEVLVGRRPRIGVIANGDELVDVEDFDEVLSGRRIANSNGPGLAAQIIEAGGEPIVLGIAKDDPHSLKERIRSGDECDGIVSAAGVSVGDHDYVKEVLDELGCHRAFWRVTMRPGSATLFGLLDRRPFWGVPGNPVSALVTFDLLVRPPIRRMAGFAEPLRAPVRVRLAEPVRAPADVTSYLRVRVIGYSDGLPLVGLSGRQGSGILSSMIADGLVALPPGVSELGEGEDASMVPLRGLATAPRALDEVDDVSP